ncbi:MAG TPA: RNA polymerase sigma factor [Anaerohalosphaeraceae bacterium]|nr:RNA polymerase sigma factor [Anaerohalosphaeraceae bacterium]
MSEQPEIVELLDECKRGNPDALGRLVELYAARCYGYFYRLTGNREVSEELLSELYMRLLEKIRSFEGGSFEKWLFTIASNLFRDRLRKQYRQKRLLEEKTRIAEIESEPEREIDSTLSDRLQQGLTRLDAETAELIVLRFYGDFSFKELSEMRSEPIGTTLSKVHRGLKKLKEWMEQPDERKQRTT